MAIIRVIVVCVVLMAAALTVACDSSGRETWLHGTWTLAYNPGHDTEDVLTFNPDGTVSIRTAGDHRIGGKYRVNGESLLMAVEGKNGPVAVQFAISPDRARLTYETGAYFTKQAAP